MMLGKMYLMKSKEQLMEILKYKDTFNFDDHYIDYILTLADKPVICNSLQGPETFAELDAIYIIYNKMTKRQLYIEESPEYFLWDLY